MASTSLRRELQSILYNSSLNRASESSEDPETKSVYDSLVLNPRTILSRDSLQLSQKFQVPLQDIADLRLKIASRILSVHEPDLDGTRVDDENDLIQNKKPFFVGSKSAWSLLGRSKESYGSSWNDPSNVQEGVLSTGSSKVDRLISRQQSRKRSRVEMANSTSVSDDATNESALSFGVDMNTIVEVYGPSGSGKTQMALTLAANAIMSTNTSAQWDVQYLASGGNASVSALARRFRQLCRARLHLVEGANSSLLERIEFDNISDGHDLLASLIRIESDMIKARKNSTISSNSTSCDTINNVLIVIDSISSTVSASLFAEGDRGTGAALLNEIQIALRRISRFRVNGQGHCVVFVANGIVSSPGDNGMWTQRPALGEQWRAADVRLLFENVHDVPNADDDINQSRKLDVKITKHYAKSIDGAAVTIGLDSSGIID